MLTFVYRRGLADMNEGYEFASYFKYVCICFGPDFRMVEWLQTGLSKTKSLSFSFIGSEKVLKCLSTRLWIIPYTTLISYCVRL